jgi:prolipoprotein diacylglyceryltransferase
MQQLPMLITIYGIASIIAAIVAYILASMKHRDASHWATVSFLFPPAALLTFFLSTAPVEHRQARVIEKKMEKYLDHD